MTEERRLVTVLFADVTGSTAMGEALDPEDMRALLGRYFAIAQEVVSQHGGRLRSSSGTRSWPCSGCRPPTTMTPPGRRPRPWLCGTGYVRTRGWVIGSRSGWG